MPKNPSASRPAPTSPETPSRTGSPAEEVFLTPRVLDQGAFESMTGELQTLIRDADGHRQTLQRTSEEVKGLSTILRTALAELQTRLDRAGAATPALERWIVEARELSSKPLDTGRATRELERAVTGIVESRKAEFEHAVAPTLETLRHLRKETERTKAGIEGVLAGAEAKVALLEARAEETAQALNDRAVELERASAERFAAAEDRLAAIERRAAGLQHRMNSMVAQADEASRRLDTRGDTQTAETIYATIEAALEGSRRVEEITRLRLAELREVENLLGTVGGRVASLRAAAMQIPEVKPKSRSRDRDAA